MNAKGKKSVTSRHQPAASTSVRQTAVLPETGNSIKAVKQNTFFIAGSGPSAGGSGACTCLLKAGVTRESRENRGRVVISALQDVEGRPVAMAITERGIT